MGDWSDIPIGLKLKMQTLNFLCFLIGTGARVGLLALSIWSAKSLRWTGHRSIWLLVFVACLMLIWLDAQWTDGHPTRHTDSTRTATATRIAVRALNVVLYLACLGVNAVLAGVLLAGWSLFDAHHLLSRQNGVAVFVSAVFLFFMWSTADDLDSPLQGLTLRGFVR